MFQEKVAKFKAEGNEYYRKDQYNEALAKYYQALPLCQQHKLQEEEALIRGNCAQACLVLELFKDAFEHANECLQLDPESSKVYCCDDVCAHSMTSHALPCHYYRVTIAEQKLSETCWKILTGKREYLKGILSLMSCLTTSSVTERQKT